MDTMDLKKLKVEIVEEPVEKMRFRYKSEGRDPGAIPGANCTLQDIRFPKIKVNGLTTRATILVSCVTREPPYRPHPFLIKSSKNGEECSDEINNGVIVVNIEPPYQDYEFSCLRLHCIRKKSANEALTKRKAAGVNPFKCPDWLPSEIGLIDFYSFRLCFQVFVIDPKTSVPVPLEPVLSQAIYDRKKYPRIVIHDVLEKTGSIYGGTSVILIVKKVVKQDIKVRLYELKEDKVVWETFADPKQFRSDRGLMFTFVTPEYDPSSEANSVNVLIQLIRPSDGEVSNSVGFTYKARDLIKTFRSNNCGCYIRPLYQPSCRIHCEGPNGESVGKHLEEEPSRL